jgi:hypothetical protein
MVRASGDRMAALWLATAFDRVRRHNGQTKSLQDMDVATMLALLIGSIIAWIIFEMLDL